MKNLRILLVALFATSPMLAQADVIAVSGTGELDGNWEITLVGGSFDDLYDTLTDQVWWGSSEVAGIFAGALDVSFPGVHILFGPYFAYDEHEGRRSRSFADVRAVGAITGKIRDLDVRADRHRTYATATRVSEPGTLALLGLGLLGMGLARRRRIA